MTRAATVFVALFAVACSPAPDEAEAALRALSTNASLYFTSEQTYSAKDGDQPWHRGVAADSRAEDDSRSIGFPVSFDEYCFPGCAEAKLVWGPDGAVQPAEFAAATTAQLFKRPVEIDHATWELRYQSRGFALKATATFTASLRADPDRLIECRIAVNDVSQEIETSACERRGF